MSAEATTQRKALGGDSLESHSGHIKGTPGSSWEPAAPSTKSCGVNYSLCTRIRSRVSATTNERNHSAVQKLFTCQAHYKISSLIHSGLCDAGTYYYAQFGDGVTQPRGSGVRYPGRLEALLGGQSKARLCSTPLLPCSESHFSATPAEVSGQSLYHRNS